MFTLYGTEPSFYTAKARLSLMALALPFHDRLKTSANKAAVEAAVGGYHRFPVVEADTGEWLVDSTRIGLALSARVSARVPSRSLLPEDPALAILVRMADDWFDEWFLRAAILFRAMSADTRRFVARVGAMNLLGLHQHDTPTAEQEAVIAKVIPGIERFFLASCATNGVVGDGVPAALRLLEETARRLEPALAPFLFGARLSLADASLWGFLDTGLLWEPEARAWTLAHAPHLARFHEAALATTQGLPAAWDSLAASAARLEPLLGGDALGFQPFLAENARAVAAGTPIAIAGVEVPSRGFTEKCRRDLGAAIRALASEDRIRLDAAIGHWPLLDTYLAGEPA
jgi:glutathione S-transferase